MKELFFTIIFGVIQGITELLPISSSAHIALVEKISGMHISLAHESILNLGSFIAVLIYFRTDIQKIFQSFIERPYYRENLIYKLILSSIPVLIIAFIFKGIIETFKYNMLLISCSLIFVGLLLYFTDKYSHKTLEFNNLTHKNYFILGIFQILSLFRGVSRSSITITASRLLGLNREESIKTSFLMSLPVMFIVSIYGIYGSTLSGTENLTPSLFIGFISSFLASYLTIKFLLSYIKTHSFLIFSMYRIFLGIMIILFLL